MPSRKQSKYFPFRKRKKTLTGDCKICGKEVSILGKYTLVDAEIVCEDCCK
jgi:hypothetical protein